MTTINAIETRYAGCRFRSRLEARWAVFFDALGVAWRYEPEGFDLDGMRDPWGGERWIEGGYYLPDFFLPQIESWYEVKGAKPTGREWDLAFLLEQSTDQRVVLAWGDIPFDTNCYGRDRTLEDGLRNIETGGDHDYAWCVCELCGHPGIEFDARSARIHTDGRHGSIGDKSYTGDHPRILAAYNAARSARFEHGQHG